jgi:hypothetical protein
VSAESDFLHEPVPTAVPARAPRRTAETVAGYLSALAIFASIIGIAWHPLRLILPSIVIALIASGMARGESRLQLAAVLICGVCLFLGLTVAVTTSQALW